MVLKNLSEIRNQYPNGSKSYIEKDDKISFVGKYSQNTILFDKRKDLNINVTEGSFEFIIKFIPEISYWTSNSFFEKLNTTKNNPYIQLNTLPIITVDLRELDSYSKSESFSIPEEYAEVDVTNTLDTKEDYIKYINWITSEDEGRAPLISTKDLGEWQLKTTDDLGFRFQTQLDELNLKIDEQTEGENPIDKESTN